MTALQSSRPDFEQRLHNVADPGIVHPDVERSELGLREACKLVDPRAVPYVARKREHTHLVCGGDLHGELAHVGARADHGARGGRIGRDADIRQNHMSTARREAAHNALAQTTRRPAPVTTATLPVMIPSGVGVVAHLAANMSLLYSKLQLPSRNARMPLPR